MVDGYNTPLGRWPNTGWMTITSHMGSKTIIDTELPSLPDWDGADLVLRVSHWMIDRNNIENHNGTTIEYKSYSGNEARDGYGYFIQNHMETLDVFGEWYFNGSKFYMFFGSGENPNDHLVKVSHTDNLVNISFKNYVKFENLALTGANSKIFSIKGSKYITIQNCEITCSGGYAVCGTENVGTKSDNLTIIGNDIRNINKVGVHLEEEFTNVRIRENRWQKIGTIPGMDGSSVNTGIGIIIKASGAIIENNILIDIGYIGILFQGPGSIVRYNLIDSFCFIKDDGAGIYTNCQCNQEISHNIILNGKGAPLGTSDKLSQANGIYIDDKGANTLILNNTLAHNVSAGIYIHNAHEITIKNNTCFNNGNQIYFVHDNNSPNDPIRNITMNGNIFFSRERSQLTLSFATVNDDIPLFGSSDRNYYVRLKDEEKSISNHIYAWSGNITSRSLPDWQFYTGQDVNSCELPVWITDVQDNRLTEKKEARYSVIKYEDSLFDIDINTIKFEYNATLKNKTIMLDRAYIDVKGTKYSGKLTLLPFTSIILMGLLFPD